MYFSHLKSKSSSALTKLNKVYPCLDAWVMMDTFQEFIFNLFVYGANMWIIFVDDDIQNMILNCMAMEFLMQFVEIQIQHPWTY